jgi:signal transducing adaptor molecule
MAAVLKRMTHRNPNVQLYSLALVEALSKNCGLQINREIASRSFTQGLERIVNDRVHPMKDPMMIVRADNLP